MKYTCKQCGKEFEITDGEAEFYRSKGLNMPKRCKECRAKNKAEKAGGSTAETEPKSTTRMPMYQQSSGQTISSKTIKIAASVIAAVLVVVAGLVSLANRNSSDKSTYAETSADFSYSSYEDYDYDYDDSDYDDSEDEYTGYEEAEETEEEAEEAQTEASSVQAAADKTSAKQTTDKWITTRQSTTKQSTVKQTTTRATTTRATTARATTARTTTTKATTTKSSSSGYRFRNDERLQEHFQKHGSEVGASSAEQYQRMAAAVITSSGAQHKNEAEDGDDIYFKASTGEIVFVSGDGYIRTYFIADQDYFDRQ